MFLVSSLVHFASAALAQVPLQNASFESPQIGEGSQISPMPDGNGWKVRGDVALRNGSYNLGTAPFMIEPAMGRQMLRMRAGTVISQSMNVVSAGTYSVAIHAAQDAISESGQTVKVMLNGVAAIVQTPTQNMSQLTFAGFALSAGAATLQIELPDPAPGKTTGGVWIDNVVLYRTDGGANAKPSAGITWPIAGQSLPDTFVDVVATATDPEGAVSKVELYENGMLVATRTQAPWVFLRNYSTVGTKSLVARVFDSANQWTDSELVAFSHSAGTLKPFVQHGGFESPRMAAQTETWNAYPGWGNFQQGALTIASGGFETPWNHLFIVPQLGRQTAHFEPVQYAQTLSQTITLPAGNYGLIFRSNAGSVGLTVDTNQGRLGTATYSPSGFYAYSFTHAGGPNGLYFRPAGYAWTVVQLDDVRVGPAGLPLVSLSLAAGVPTTSPASLRFLGNVEVYDRTITQAQLVDVTTGAEVIVGTQFGHASSPTFEWIVLKPGTSTVRMKVADSFGFTTYSAPLTFSLSAPSIPALYNAGFEALAAFGGSSQIGIGVGWLMGGTCFQLPCGLIAARGSGYLPASSVVPEGVSAGLLRGNGFLSQSIHIPAGTFVVSVKAAAVGTVAGQNFKIIVNGTDLGTFTPLTTSFATFVSNAFSISPAGVYSVRMEGAASNSANFVAIDDVQIYTPNVLPTVTITCTVLLRTIIPHARFPATRA
jgi:Bacterial Ig domain/Protein of unknown function (DUF642)